jgi:hypothetical protein
MSSRLVPLGAAVLVALAPVVVLGAPQTESTPPAQSAQPTASAPATPGAQPTPSEAVQTPAEELAVAPPPDVAAGERSDGRLDPPPDREWRRLPQVLLFPFRAIFWLLQWPVVGLVRLEDRHQILAHVVSALTWSGGTRGIRPAFYYTTVTVPEFGLKYFDRRTLGVDTRLDLLATTGGPRYIYTDLILEPTRISSIVAEIFDIAFDRRADLTYNGLGGHIDGEAPTGRYLMNSLDGYAVTRVRLLPGFSIYASVGGGFKRFGDGDNVGGDPAIASVYDVATIPNFASGETFVRAAAGFALDTRDSPVRGATGLLLRGGFDYTYDFTANVGYERLSGTASLPISLWQRTHVLWLSATTQLAFRNGRDIPFTELPTLGGAEDLRGFHFQQFRDYSSFVTTAEYRWPIWMWMDGAIFGDYGGVFGPYFHGFGAQRMQGDIGFGIRLVTSQQFFVRAQFAYGFGQGWTFTLSGNAK